MAANTDPIFSRTPDVKLATVSAVIPQTNANTSTDGTSSASNMWEIFQADTTEGGYVQKIILKAIGSPSATVARVFLSSITGALTIGTTNTAVNTMLIAELGLPAITVSQTGASPHFEIPLNMALPAGYRLLISFGTSTGSNNGYSVITVGGKY